MCIRDRSRQPVTYQHLEEFLIAAGKKEKVTISAREVGKEYYELKDSLKESFYIQRSGWGHLRLDVEAVGAVSYTHLYRGNQSGHS